MNSNESHYSLQTAYVHALQHAARPDVRIIRPDNGNGGLAPFSREVAANAYAIHLADRARYRAVFLDFDTKKSGPEQAAEDAESATDLLNHAGIHCVVAQSGPGGGRHVWATVAGDGLRAIDAHQLAVRLAVIYPSLDITPMTNSKTGAGRPPGAPHRSGGTSEVLGSDASALAILRRGNPPELFEALRKALPPSRARPQALISPRSDSEAPSRPAGAAKQYASGSEEVLAIAVRAVNQGDQFDVFVATVTGPEVSPAVATTVAKHRGPHRREWLKREWRKALEFVKSNPRASRASAGGADAEVVRSWDAHLNAVKAGLTSSEYRVATVLLRQAWQCNEPRILVGMAVRTAAECAGVSKSSAQRALESLAARNMIEVAGIGKGVNSRRYRLMSPTLWLQTPAACSIQALYHPPREELAPESVRLARNLSAMAWMREGLGEARRGVYLELALGPVSGSGATTATELAARLNRDPSTVRRHLHRLEEVGLARRQDRGGWSPEYRDDADLAWDLGIPSLKDDRIAHHARESRAHRLRLVKRRLTARGIEPVVLRPTRWGTDGASHCARTEKYGPAVQPAVSIGPTPLTVKG